MIPTILSTNWKLAAGAILGAALCWPVASCQGRRSAEEAQSERIIAASAKVTEAAQKAETAAILADMARSVNTASEAKELREVINETKSDAGVGPATAELLRELRQRRSGSARAGS